MAVNVAALLAALRADPAAKDAVRRELLTEELLALPVLVAQLATRLDQLTAQVQELVQAQAQTHATLQPLVGYVAALRGAMYERAVVRPRMVAF